MHRIAATSSIHRLAGGLLLALSASAALAQSPAPAAWSMDADVERVRTLFNVPGIAIAVVKDGKVLAARGFGVRKLGDAAPVDGQTLFEIAANSKSFAAAMMAMLVDEGKLAWDDPVIKHLPDFQMFDPRATREMTIRDLLANRSGLGEGAGDMLWWPATRFSTDEIIHQLRYIPPARSFRSSYMYEYLPFIVAGKIVSRKMGKPWGEAVRERIFAPLGMTDSTTSLAGNAGRMDVAAPHARVDGKMAVVAPLPTANAIGAVGINSSADDLARWMMALLGGTPRRLFSDAQARELWTPQTPIPIRAPKPQLAATRPNFAAYGLGFDLRDYHGMQVVSHGGWQIGFYSTVVLVPSAHLGIAILTNADSSPAMNALKYRLLDHYTGLAPADWIAAQAAVAAWSDDETPLPPKQAGAILGPVDGAYRDAWYGSATITAAGAGHVLTLNQTPGLTGTLEHYRNDTFIVHWKERSFNADAWVTFARKPDGSVERITMAPVSGETDSSFDFHDLAFKPVATPVPAR
jgi:CubicO group peptidase (beta-lactamase class C family)